MKSIFYCLNLKNLWEWTWQNDIIIIISVTGLHAMNWWAACSLRATLFRQLGSLHLMDELNDLLLLSDDGDKALCCDNQNRWHSLSNTCISLMTYYHHIHSDTASVISFAIHTLVCNIWHFSANEWLMIIINIHIGNKYEAVSKETISKFHRQAILSLHPTASSHLNSALQFR